MSRCSHLARSSARRSTVALAIAVAAISAAPALAVDGVWINTAGGTYGDGANWFDGVVAQGLNATADFNTLDITGVVPVAVAADTTVGNLIFGDSDVSTPGGWQFTGSILTLAGTAPTITTNALAAGSTARIDNVIAGTNGLNITGPGTLHLTAANNYTGNTTLNSANLRLGAQNTFAPSMLGLVPAASGAAVAVAPDLILNGTNTITNGNTASGTMFIGNNIVANAGSSTTFNLGNRSSLGQNGTGIGIRNVSGSGDIIFNLGSNTTRNDFLHSFANFTGTVTFTGALVPSNTTPPDGVLVNPYGRLMANGGNIGAGFANANVVMDGFAVLRVRTNSGGNTINLGSLSSTTATTGFDAPEAGAAATFSIGGLNTSTSFAGLFRGNNIVTKVGTGTLTFTNAQFHTNNTNINAGTLKLTQNANLATSPIVTIANGATFDVGTTNTVYETAASQTLQSVAGSTVSIIGPYNHNQGTLTPGTQTGAGTINFTGDLTLAGGIFNTELSPNSAPGGTNDLINVSGTASLGGNVALNIGLLGGLNTGTYTILQAGAITGSTAGWAVNYGARGAPPTLTQTATALTLTVSSAVGAPLIWKGTVDGAWNVNGTANFLNTTTNAQDKFFQLDSVRFDDSASNFNVVLAGALSPSSVVVDNTTDYTFSGTGSIVGGGSLTKRGTGALTLSTTNSYSGGTVLEAGLLNTGTLGGAPLGTGTITLAGGTLRGVSPTGGNATFGQPIVVTGNATIETANSYNTAVPPVAQLRQTTLSGPISGNGTLNLVNIDPNAVQAVKGIDITGDSSGFAGSLNVGPAIAVRLGNATANGNAALAVNISAGSSIGTFNTSNALNIPLGSLSGSGTLRGHSSTGSGNTVTYAIGGLNTSTTFSGAVVDGAQGTIVRPVSITKVGTGTLTLSGTNTYTGATTVQGGTLLLTGGATAPVLGDATVIAPGGADIQGGKLVLDYTGGTSPAQQVRDALVAGYAQTPRFATGQIRSTTLEANRTLGYVDNAAASTVTVAYTRPGDANLDFTVNFSDLVRLAQNYNQTGRVWEQGDFNYDSNTNFGDLVLLAQNYNQSALTPGQVTAVGASFASEFALAQTMVPEPTTMAVLGGIATMALRRRRA